MLNPSAAFASPGSRLEVDGLHRFDAQYDPESFGYAQFDAVTVAHGGTLEVVDGFLIETSELHVSGSLHLQGSLSQFSVMDGAGNGGSAHFAENASVRVHEAATLWTGAAVSHGAAFLVEAPRQTEDGFVESTQMIFESFTAQAGHTAITAGGESPQEDASAAVISAAFDTERLEISEGASLAVSVGYGGRFMAGGIETATDMSSSYLPQGGIGVFQKRAVLSPSFRLAIGGSDAARAAAQEQGWSLWVGEGGTLALEGKDASVTVGQGGSARFEKDALLWIVDGGIQDLREGETFEVTGLDLRDAYVSGLENLSFMINGESMEGSLYLDGSGKLIGVAGSLRFEGPFAPILSELYAERKSVTTSDFYRRLFTISPESASETMNVLASAGSVSGTDERMLMGAAGISLRLREALRTAERHVGRAEASRAAREAAAKGKKVPDAAPEAQTNEGSDTSGWLSKWKEGVTRKMPEVMQNVPLLLSGFAGNSRTDVSRPLIGGKHRTKSDDAGFEAAVILGKKDWRFGAAGTFITRDIEVQGEQSTRRKLAIEAESDEMSVSLFARHPLWNGFVTADATWQEASDAYRTPLNEVILQADDVKRTSYSAGIFYEQPLGNWGSWAFSGFGGLPYVTSDKAEIRWTAPSGEVLSVHEGKRSAVIGTVGGSAFAGIDFEAASGWFGSYKPRRMDAGFSAALHAVSADGRRIAASAPGAESSADCGQTRDADLLQASAEITAGIEWQETRFEIAGWAYRAGSEARAFGGTARLSWRLNAL